MKDLRILFTLVKRNIKLYFKDKGVFFLSLITPLILLVLVFLILDKPSLLIIHSLFLLIKFLQCLNLLRFLYNIQFLS